MLNKFYTAYILIFLAVPVFAQTAWQSDLVKVDEKGVITYHKDADGFVIPDFSHAGYKGGEPIPNYQPPVSRIENVSPIANADNTANIQQAINKIASLTPDANGFRGVVQLAAGRYYVDATINLNASGVILRGAGRGRDAATSQITETDLQNMTMIYRRGTGGALATNVIVIGAANASATTWGANTSNETYKVNITTQKVMPGNFSFDVQSAAGYSVGDAVCIKYPSTEQLLAALWYGGNTNWVNGGDASQKWAINNINISFHRYIVKIEGNRITVDAPIFYCLDRQYSQPYMHKITTGTVYTNIGIENLRISMDRTPSSITDIPDQNCIKMNALENCWAKGLHLCDFIRSGIQTEAVTRSTVEDCRAVDCSGYITGSSQYNFNNYARSQLILFKNCVARDGRHHWISNGTSTVSGIVVLNFTSSNSAAASEGHRYLSQGILIDGWKEVGTFANNAQKIGFYLRDNMGTYHGWGAIFSVLWNCDINNGTVLLDKVPTGQNYSIGSTALTVRKYRNSDSKYTTGYNEGQNRQGLYPKSLYEAQLNARSLPVDFTINEHPKPVKTCLNSNAGFSVNANLNTVTVKWKKDGQYIEGAVGKTYYIDNVTNSDVGVYSAEVSYEEITKESEPAELSLFEPLPAELQFSDFPEIIYAGGNYRIETGDPVTGLYPDVISYQWSYSGTGVYFNSQITNPVEISVSKQATDGILKANVSHPCGTKAAEKNITIHTATGNPELTTDNIHIFPNPADDTVYIQNLQSVKQIEIINVSGQKLFYMPVDRNSSQITVSLSDYPSGVYMLRILFDSDEEKIFKLIKK